MKELLKELCTTFGPSGRESQIIKKIQEKVSPHADEMKIDTLGTLMVLKKGQHPQKKLMFAAHADEIGLVVTYIDTKGFLHFSTIGGVNLKEKLGGVRVLFENNTHGIIQKRNAMKETPNHEAEFYIDIATMSREESQTHVKVGDFAVFQGETHYQGDYCISKALDNRIGCAILIEALKKIKIPHYDTWFVFTTQEEVGARGAQTATYQIDPDYGFAVDVTLCGDNPQEYPLNMKCGDGVAIKARDRSIIVPTAIIDLLIETAEEHKIPWQMEVLPFGGTDAGVIQLARGGVQAGTLSIPCRYVHTPSEMVHLKDVEATKELVVALCNRELN